MTNTNENQFDVNFDESSGISIEEQKEILSKIDSITEKNRNIFSSGAKGKNKINAKKRGAFFQSYRKYLQTH